MENPKYRKLTIRMPEGLAVALDGFLEAENRAARRGEKVSVNEYVVESVRSRLESGPRKVTISAWADGELKPGDVVTIAEEREGW